MQHCISSARCLSCHTADKAARHTPVPPPQPPAPQHTHPVHLFSLTGRSFTQPVPNPPTLALLLHLPPTPHIFWNPAQVYQEMQLPSCFFSCLSLRPPFLLFCPQGKTTLFLSSCSFSTMPCFLFTNIHLLSCFHPQLFLLPRGHWRSLCSLLPHATPCSAKVTAPEEITGERITTHLPVSQGLSSSMISVPLLIPVSPSIFQQPFSRPCPGSLFHPGNRGVN